MRILFDGCPCGETHPFTDFSFTALQAVIEASGDELATVTVGARKWRISKWYIACHGLKAWELEQGLYASFAKEITDECSESR